MKCRGVVKLARPLPLTIWSLPTVAMGFLIQSRRVAAHTLVILVLTALAAMILQGIITHGLNDLYDWDSGTDRETTGIISGGSRVIGQGLLTVRQIWQLIAMGTAAYIIMTGIIISVRGWPVALWAGLGLMGAVFYSLPPLRLSYRPFLGEWGALFPAMASGVMLGAIAKNPQMSWATYAGALTYGVFCVASVMQHHLADMDADWQALPRKRTTPAYWHLQRHQSPLRVILAYESFALLFALVSSIFITPLLTSWVIVSAVAMAVTWTTPVEGGPWILTKRDLALKILAVAGVLGMVR